MTTNRIKDALGNRVENLSHEITSIINRAYELGYVDGMDEGELRGSETREQGIFRYLKTTRYMPTEWNNVFVITDCLSGGGDCGISISIDHDRFGDDQDIWTVGGSCVDIATGGSDGFYDVEESVKYAGEKMAEAGISSPMVWDEDEGVFFVNTEEEARFFFSHYVRYIGAYVDENYGSACVIEPGTVKVS